MLKKNKNFIFRIFLYLVFFTSLFLFSLFYTSYYPNTTGGDEVFYMNLAGRMIGLPFTERIAVGITQLLNFGWPVILSYYPDFSLESNIPLTFVRVALLTFSIFYFYKSFKINNLIILLLIPFAFQASIYAGSLIRDDLIFSFYLLVISLLKNISLKKLPLIIFCFVILITLRVPLIISVIPLVIALSYKFIKKNKLLIFIMPFVIFLFAYFVMSLGIENYITAEFLSSVNFDLVNIIRPFITPLNPFLVGDNIRYDNPVIFILMTPIKFLFILSIIFLIIFRRKFPYFQELFFILLSAFPYMLISDNLGLRQALPIQFCIYALICNAMLNHHIYSKREYTS